MTPAQALAHGVAELALDLPSNAEERLLRYLRLLTKWNRTYNLTAVRDPLEMVSVHVLDSLAVVPHLELPAGAALADVGAGAGLPGIALAIARPQWRVTLNDASDKKCTFMRQALIELGLANAEVHHGRVEEWAPRPRFVLAISRAFAELSQFLARCSHLVERTGWLAVMTGAAPQAEGCRVVALRVPLLEARRHLVLCPPLT